MEPLSERTTAGRATELVVAKVVSTAGLSGVAIVAARQLGPEDRGVMVVVVTVAALSALVGTGGVNISGRLLLVAPATPVLLTHYVGLSLLLATATAAATAAVTTAALAVAGMDTATGTVSAAAAYGGATALGYLLLDGLFAFGHTRSAAISDATNGLVQLTAVGALVLVGSRSPAVYVAAASAGPLVQAAIAARSLRAHGHRARPALSRRQWRDLLRRGAPGVPFLVAQAALYRLDRYLVGVLMTPTAVGLYSVGATGAELIRFLPTAVGQIVLYRVAAGHQDPRRLARLRMQVALATLALAMLGTLVAPLAVSLVFGDEFEGSVGPLRILLLAEVAIALYFVDSAILTASGRLGSAGAVTTVGLVAVTVGDFALVPALGVNGAAWASLAGYALMAGSTHAVLRRALRDMGTASLAGSDGPTGEGPGRRTTPETP